MSKKTLMIIGVVVVLALGFFMTQTANKPAEQPAQEEAKAPEKAAFHIGIVTGTVSQSEDDLRGAELAIREVWRCINRRNDQASDLPRQLHV